MNGKKVDMEKGSILKAEMAKKNLHTKRPSVVTLLFSLSYYFDHDKIAYIHFF